MKMGWAILGIVLALACGAAGPGRTRASAVVEVYVSPAGSDANEGTRERPFATPARARDAIRAWRKAHPQAREGATVWLRGGAYALPEPLVLTAEDSETTWRAFNDEEVRWLNARRIDARAFRPITDRETRARIPASLRGKIVALDLKALGIRHRARYKDVFTDNGGLLELYVNRQRQPLSRFPNATAAGEAYLTMKRVLDTGGGLQDRNWREPSNVAKPPANEGGAFEYREAWAARHAVWQGQLERGVWLKGYWRVPWQSEAVRVQAIDTAKRTVTLARPVPGGIGSKYHRPEGSGEEPYWLMNLLEEVDAPGEWCVDFKDEKLYFYPPGRLDGAELLLADQEEPVVRITDGARITLRGLTIEGSLGHGIQVQGGAENLIAGCTVRNVGRYAVVLDGGARHAVQSCDLYDLGAGGVWLGGGDERSQPRVPAGHRVVNNHIHHFARIEKVYAPGVNAGYTGGGGGGHHAAVGMYVAHNLIHDTPHVGVLFGSWDGLFEYNEIFHYCLVSNDMGGFYSYDQYERMGNHTFRYNFLHSSDDGDGIYFDHDHREMHIYGNIVYLKSTGKRGMAYLYKSGSQARNPQTIECYNNIAIGSRFGFTFVTGPGSKIENNVSVMCKTPFGYAEVRAGKEQRATEALASGKNVAYEDDPGFVDLKRFDLRLRPEARIFRDLPGFQAIPVEKIGLYVDEYRKRLPTEAELDRFGQRAGKSRPGYEVLDRN